MNALELKYAEVYSLYISSVEQGKQAVLNQDWILAEKISDNNAELWNLLRRIKYELNSGPRIAKA